MITTAFGFICATGEINLDLLLPTLGIFLLASSSAALNQYQERKIDSIMERTKSRPIPSGRISERNALAVIFYLGFLGSLFLIIGTGLIGLALGLLAMFWYNGVYTPLKRVTPLAIIPGAIIGSIPPVVGWVAGGGALLSPQIIAISFFLFIWQIPHFWLLLLVFGKDYEQAGLPSLTKTFSDKQLARITFVWTFATAMTSLLLPIFNVIKINYGAFLILILAIGLVVYSARLLKNDVQRPVFRYTFNAINIFTFSIVLFISIGKLLILY